MSTTHCSCAGEADRSVRIAGIATLTMVASIETISRLRQQETRMTALRLGVMAATVSFTQRL